MVKDGLWCSYYDVHMATHGGTVAKEYGVSRQEQDQWALRSQQLAQKAIETDRIADEIVAVEVKTRKETIVIKKMKLLDSI